MSTISTFVAMLSAFQLWQRQGSDLGGGGELPGDRLMDGIAFSIEWGRTV